MSGAWINCEGSLKAPAPGPMSIPKWAKTDFHKQMVGREYGACSVCAKAVKLRGDGTVRVHVNTEVAKQQRQSAAERARDTAVSDLLKMREELSGG